LGRRSLVTPAFGGCAAFGRIHDGATTRRNDVNTLAPSAPFHEDHNGHKAHKESLVNLFDGLRPLAGPRFAR
jgi:hypothetical protein